jgi:hypothetical protein
MRSSGGDADGGAVARVIGVSLRRHGLLDGPDAASLVRRWRFELCLRVGRRVLVQLTDVADDMSVVREELDAMVAEIADPPSVVLRNCTAHPVEIHTAGRCLLVEPSGTVARCAEDPGATAAPAVVRVSGHPVVVVSGATESTVTGLPPREDGVLCIVSRLVAQAYPRRPDLVFPHTLVRGADGRSVGCRVLARLTRDRTDAGH